MNWNDLVGKTIKELEVREHHRYDDTNHLDIKFTDGTKATIVATYGGYSGDSYGEYCKKIELHEYGYKCKDW